MSSMGSSLIIYRNVDKLIQALREVRSYFDRLRTVLKYEQDEFPQTILCKFEHNLTHFVGDYTISLSLREVIEIFPEIETFYATNQTVVGERIRRVLKELNNLEEAVSKYGLKSLKMSINAQYYSESTFGKVAKAIGEFLPFSSIKEFTAERTDHIVKNVEFNHAELVGLIHELKALGI